MHIIIKELKIRFCMVVVEGAGIAQSV